MFFAEGLARLPAEFVARKRPSVQVISDAALRDAQARKPDFIFSLAVMQHVPPEDLSDYFRRIVSLAAPHSRIEIGHWLAVPHHLAAAAQLAAQPPCHPRRAGAARLCAGVSAGAAHHAHHAGLQRGAALASG